MIEKPAAPASTPGERGAIKVPFTKPLTVLVFKDSGSSQARLDVAALSDGAVTMRSVSEMYFHQLRLECAKDPKLLEKIAVFYVDERGTHEVGLRFEDELKWPVGFLQEALSLECDIREARSGKSGTIPVKAPGCDRCGKIFLDCQCAATGRASQGDAAAIESFAQQLDAHARAGIQIEGDFQLLMKRLSAPTESQQGGAQLSADSVSSQWEADVRLHEASLWEHLCPECGEDCFCCGRIAKLKLMRVRAGAAPLVETTTQPRWAIYWIDGTELRRYEDNDYDTLSTALKALGDVLEHGLALAGKLEVRKVPHD